MLVYIIQCEEVKGHTGLLGIGGKVSQEGHQTLEDAQNFVYQEVEYKLHLTHIIKK